MLDKHAIREIPVSPETPGFYSLIFLVGRFSTIRISTNLWCPHPFGWRHCEQLWIASASTEHLRTFEGLKSVRNVGDLYRFKRHLLSRGRGARAYQVPPLRIQRQGLRVPGAPLRSVNGYQSHYKERKGHRGLPQGTRCQYAPVLG